MIFALLRDLGIVDNHVQLGLSVHMGNKQRHGVVHYDTATGIRHIGFLADKPQRLGRADKDQVSNLFQQLDKIGCPAISLEVKQGRSAFLIKRPSASLAAARLRSL